MKKTTKPKLSDPKDQTLAFKVSSEDCRKIKENAQARGLSVSSFARLAATEKRMPAAKVPTVNLKTWGELGRIGNNLNQISKHLNQTGEIDASIYKVVTDLKTELHQIRNDLINISEVEE